jgi:hypothetical protein
MTSVPLKQGHFASFRCRIQVLENKLKQYKEFTMVVKYDVTVQPVKLICSACRRGATYVVSYERRSSAEYVSHPQPASRDGEVVFGSPTGDINVPSFLVNFDVGSDKKLLSFALYDFSRRPKVERMLEFDVALGEFVDWRARQSFCEVKTFPFRSGKVSGELRVILRMYPVGEAVVPTMTSNQPTGSVMGEVLQTLQQEKLVPASLGELVGDADVIEELLLKARLLKESRSVKKAPDPLVEQRLQQRAELQALLDELEAAERRDGGRSQLASADRHMLELLEEEKRNWQDAAGVAAGNSDFGTPSAQQANPVSPNVADPGLLHELNAQKSQLQRHLESLDKQQNRRDVTKEAIDTLDAIKHLDNVIEETSKAAQRPAAGAAQRRNQSQVRFKDDADDNTPEGLAQRLLHAHCDHEATEYSIRVLEVLKQKPYDGYQAGLRDIAEAVPPPKNIQGITGNRRKGLPPQPAAVPVQQTQSYGARASTSGGPGALLDDLFATAPPSSIVSRNTSIATAPSTTAQTRTAPPSAMDDLFGGPAPAPRSTSPQSAQTYVAPQQQHATPVQSQPHPYQTPAPQQQYSAPPPLQQQHAAPAPPLQQAAQPSPQIPNFDVLPIPTTTTPAKFTQCTQLAVRCQAVKFADYTKTKFVRGSEVEFCNDGPNALKVSNVATFQEDIFTSSEAPIQSKCNTTVCIVPPGRSSTVYLSFGAAQSMTNGMMVVLRVTLETESGARIQDSVRVTL